MRCTSTCSEVVLVFPRRARSFRRQPKQPYPATRNRRRPARLLQSQEFSSKEFPDDRFDGRQPFLSFIDLATVMKFIMRWRQ
jgi:hypothetical protein